MMCRLYTSVMAENKTRVDFNAPASLVERADTVADVLDISRTRLLIDALQDELDELATDDGFRRRLSDAYYTGNVDFETVESILGREEAMRMKLLRASLDREPPEPQLEDGLPSDDAFYDGEVSEWTPDDSSDDDRSETRN
jgi:predicted transcriptional regulator